MHQDLITVAVDYSNVPMTRWNSLETTLLTTVRRHPDVRVTKYDVPEILISAEVEYQICSFLSDLWSNYNK